MDTNEIPKNCAACGKEIEDKEIIHYEHYEVFCLKCAPKKRYNKTQLNPDATLERHIFHRDQFAHVLRWFYVAKLMRSIRGKLTVLDFGCGNANLLKLLYHNRCAPSEYLGLDIRKQTIDKLKEEWKEKSFITFMHIDLCHEHLFALKMYDIIVCFEVVEHIGKQNIDVFLKNIIKYCHNDSIILLSTPNYNDDAGAANNHIIDGEIGEWKHDDLQAILEKYFIIDKKIGTFASMKDYKNLMLCHQHIMFDELSQYYDSNMMSIIFAPMFPKQARNCLWVMRRKQ